MQTGRSKNHDETIVPRDARRPLPGFRRGDETGAGSADEGGDKPSFEQYLRARLAVDPAIMARTFMSAVQEVRRQIRPRTGLVFGNYLPTDGINHSATISTSRANRARTEFVYAARSAASTPTATASLSVIRSATARPGKEYLAAHLGEPVRNFGMGGYGVYQAYRRLLREEKTDHAADYVIFFIWGDDHIRSLLRCRHVSFTRPLGRPGRLHVPQQLLVQHGDGPGKREIRRTREPAPTAA